MMTDAYTIKWIEFWTEAGFATNGRRTPEEYAPAIAFKDHTFGVRRARQIIAIPPGMPNSIIERWCSIELDPEATAANEKHEVAIIKRSCWQLTCMAEAGRQSEIDQHWAWSKQYWIALEAQQDGKESA